MVFGQGCRILISFLILLEFVACGSNENGGGKGKGEFGRSRGGRRKSAAVPVKIDQVTRQDISEYILANTTLDAERWVNVRSRTSGQVLEIVKEEGDRVETGSVLARLDAEVASLRVNQMGVAHREAQRNFERESKMHDRNLVSEERFENVKTQLERTKSQLEEAKLNLSYKTIVSPISGLVTIRNIEVGDMVTNNLEIFSVADFNPLLARIRVTEKDFGKITVGQKAKIIVEAIPGREFQGWVKMISPVIDPESGTIKVTVEIPGKGDEDLRPGMFASVYIITETHQKGLVIPKKALVLEGEGNQVFVYEKNEKTEVGKAIRQKIKIGFNDSDRLEVLSGLEEGQWVIIVGHEGLRPGSEVRLVGEGNSSSSSSANRKGDQQGRNLKYKGGKSRSLVHKGRGGKSEGRKRAEMSVDALNKVQKQMFDRFPKMRIEFDKRLKTDPELVTSDQKWKAFVNEMRKNRIIKLRK